MSISRDLFISWIREFASSIAENKEFLTQLNSAIGDADHGINMDQGVSICGSQVAHLSGSGYWYDL